MLNGGQRRTIQSGCGWSCRKTPRECDYLFKLHRKRCEDCRDKGDLPAFNNVNASANGWNGVNHNFQVQQGYTTGYSTTLEGFTTTGNIETAHMPTLVNLEALLGIVELANLDAPVVNINLNPKKKKTKKSKK